MCMIQVELIDVQIGVDDELHDFLVGARSHYASPHRVELTLLDSEKFLLDSALTSS